jgi:dipicolinate synthase subunit A
MNFLIYGEDCRHAILSDLLQQAGHTLQAPADLLILSPKESFTAHTDVINKNCFIWGGIPSETASLQTAGYRKLRQSAAFRIKNSVYTAEGALALAISESKTALCESRVLILGYGFLGKECARLFTTLGAAVTVYTENPEEFSAAIQKGFSAKKLTELDSLAGTIVINTIPAPVLDSLPVSCDISPALLLELASTPCRTAPLPGLTMLTAGALPSRFSPVSAAKLIFDEIIEQI